MGPYPVHEDQQEEGLPVIASGNFCITVSDMVDIYLALDWRIGVSRSTKRLLAVSCYITLSTIPHALYWR